MANEMKPGWEQTIMAEDIFKRGVGYHLAMGERACGDIGNDELWERMANAAMDAAVIFRRVQKERKFPDLMPTKDIENE